MRLVSLLLLLGVASGSVTANAGGLESHYLVDDYALRCVDGKWSFCLGALNAGYGAAARHCFSDMMAVTQQLEGCFSPQCDRTNLLDRLDKIQRGCHSCGNTKDLSRGKADLSPALRQYKMICDSAGDNAAKACGIYLSSIERDDNLSAQLIHYLILLSKIEDRDADCDGVDPSNEDDEACNDARAQVQQAQLCPGMM
jgi:hypothetical protein